MPSDMQPLIVSHHVGGRGFGVELQYPHDFRDDVVNVIYEADLECAEEMIRTNTQPNFYVAPFCLGASDGDGTLNIMANPYFSSLLEPEPGFSQASCEVRLSGAIDGISVQGARYDALYGDENRILRRTPVKIHSLDSLRREGKLPYAAAPDFLSLDTQGTECDILEGARNTMRESVIAFSCEVEFRPMYRNQKLFSSIFDFALAEGFEFVGFTHTQDIAPERMPIGLRVREPLAFGDALFFRRIDHLRDHASSPENFSLMASKLAFIALCFEYLGFAVTALHEAAKITTKAPFPPEIASRSYIRFLDSLYGAIKKVPDRYLHTDRDALVAELRKNLHRFPLCPPNLFRRNNLKPAAEVGRMLNQHGFHRMARIARSRRSDAARFVPGSVRSIRSTVWRAMVFRVLKSVYRFLNP